MQNQGFIIAKEGLVWITVGLLVTLLLYGFFGLHILPIFSAALTAFFLIFFRNPERHTPQDLATLISPADGQICQIIETNEKRFLKKTMTRISIFMSPLNCHVNRSPFEAQVKSTHYNPGKFHFAKVDKASELNEQHAFLLEDKQKREIVVIQIAGWLCRRIVSYVHPGDLVQKGQRLGIIQFGSRVDIYLPSNVEIQVKEGDSVKAGLSILGRFI